MELTSGDIKLRGFYKTDCDRLAELANNENISRNLTDGFPHPYTLEHAEEFIVFQKSIFKQDKLWNEIRFAKINGS